MSVWNQTATSSHNHAEHTCMLYLIVKLYTVHMHIRSSVSVIESLWIDIPITIIMLRVYIYIHKSPLISTLGSYICAIHGRRSNILIGPVSLNQPLHTALGPVMFQFILSGAYRKHFKSGEPMHARDQLYCICHGLIRFTWFQKMYVYS